MEGGRRHGEGGGNVAAAAAKAEGGTKSSGGIAIASALHTLSFCTRTHAAGRGVGGVPSFITLPFIA
jgi:hypothetical protein